MYYWQRERLHIFRLHLLGCVRADPLALAILSWRLIFLSHFFPYDTDAQRYMDSNIDFIYSLDLLILSEERLLLQCFRNMVFRVICTSGVLPYNSNANNLTLCNKNVMEMLWEEKKTQNTITFNKWCGHFSVTKHASDSRYVEQWRAFSLMFETVFCTL